MALLAFLDGDAMFYSNAYVWPSEVKARKNQRLYFKAIFDTTPLGRFYFYNPKQNHQISVNLMENGGVKLVIGLSLKGCEKVAMPIIAIFAI